jgi:hypothetical protein
MGWPALILRTIQELKGVLNALCFVAILYGVAKIVKAARGR